MVAMRSLLPGPSQGLRAPQVANIPQQWDPEWFRSFITTHLNPYALQGTQGQAQQGQPAPTPPTMTVAVNGPVLGTQFLSTATSYPTTQANWTQTQTVHTPDAVAFNVQANGGVVDLLLAAMGSWGNGYVIRFDARSGQVAGQIYKMTAGAITAIGSAQASPNSAPLGGTYRVVAVIGLSGAMHLYVDGELQWVATDTTYSLSGATWMTTEVVTPATVVSPTTIDGTLDMQADGVEYVHLAASHAVGNVAYNFRGAWTSGNSYVQGDEVVYGQTYWLALASSTGSAPSTSNANWQAVASYSQFQGAWSAVTSYVIGDEVTYNGNYWVCIAANTNSAPTTSNANWQIAGPTSLDEVANGTTFAKTQRFHPNLIPDSEFVFGSAFWSLDAATVVPTPNGNGGNSLSIPYTETGTNVHSQYIPVAANTVYTLSATSDFTNLGGSGNTMAYLRVDFYNSSYTRLGDAYCALNTYADSNNPAGCTAQTYNQISQYCARSSITFTTPSSTAYAVMTCQVGPNATANHWILSSPQLEAGSVSSTYVPNVPGAITTDKLTDGSTYIRMPTPPAASAAAVTSLSQSGSTTTITVGASTVYLGALTLNLPAGSVNPGSYGTYYVYANVPNWNVANTTYYTSTTNVTASQGPFYVALGSVTTTSSGGGSGGGHYPCFSGDTRIKTPMGWVRFDELPQEFEIVNQTGRHRAVLLTHAASITPMRRMGPHLVTEEHRMQVGDRWEPAAALFHERAPIQPRTVYNVHVLSDDPKDMHYLLENGLTAHNIKM